MEHMQIRFFISFIVIILCIFTIGCEEQKTKELNSDLSIIYGPWRSEQPNSLTSKYDTIIIKNNSVQLDRIKPKLVTYLIKDNVIGVHPIDAPEGIIWFTIVPQHKDKILIKDKSFGDKIYIKTTTGEVESILNTEVKGPNSKPISLKR